METRNLLKQIIEHKLEKYNNYFIKMNYFRGISDFYQAFSLSFSVLNFYNGITLSKREFTIRNRLYKKILTKGILEDVDREKVNNFINLDMAIIREAIDLLDNLAEQKESYISGENKDDFVAISASEVNF